MNIPLNIDWQQILLHLFNFSILIGGLYLLLYRPIQDFMKKREAHYREIDRQAEETRAQAVQLQQKYQEQLSSINAELAQKRSDVQKELDQYRAQQLDAARREAEEILSQAKASARQEHDKMLANASRELTELAVTAAEKLVLKGQGDPYDQFLNLAEKGEDGNEKSQ